MHCHHHVTPPRTRRQMLRQCANGFGALALGALLNDACYGAKPQADITDPLAPKDSHFKARAKSIIFLYMDGGPSQVDTFDPKPRLDREHGQPIKMKVPPTQFNSIGTVLKSPWKFKKNGKSGIPVSDLFPNVAQHVDDLCVIRSMVSNYSEHSSANYFLHSGYGQPGRPSMGSWLTYGLGSESRNLPGFVVLDSGLIPPGGVDCFTNGFLPASYRGTPFHFGPNPVADIRPIEAPPLQQGKLALLRKIDKSALQRVGGDERIETAIANYELAFRMQTAVPDLTSLAGETPATQALYGFSEPYAPTQQFARQCLLARRLIEKGVRFVEVLCPIVNADRWDQHNALKAGHEANARATDKPIAGLLKDLKSRGLLDSTLVLWGGEFGRTPMAQGSDGRDHNPFGFSIWLAGGGVKAGTIYGQTDEYGYYAVENKVAIHDLHATMLHLLGMDHKKLIYRFGGRDMRLTGEQGEVVKDIIA